MKKNTETISEVNTSLPDPMAEDAENTCNNIPENKKEKFRRYALKFFRILTVITAILLPLIALFMSECVHGVFIYSFSPAYTIANLILFSVLYAAGVILTGTLRRSVYLITPLIFIFSVISEVILQFRGTPLMPADILSIATGLNVAEGYHFTFSPWMALGAAILAAMIAGAALLPPVRPAFKRTLKYKIIIRILCLAFIVAAAVPFYTTDFAANHSVKPDFWNQARGYKNSGTLLNFVLNTKYLIIEKPEGYSSDEIPSIIYNFLDKNSDDPGILKSSEIIQEAEKARLEAEAQAEAALQAENNNSSEIQASNAASPDTAAENAQTEAAASSDVLTEESEPPAPNSGFDTLPAVKCTSSENQPAQPARLKKGKLPNIIVIMNETWTDLRVLGGFETNMDYMPFTRNLTRNTIKGNLYMPVIGAGTSNSEFEFLTGNSMAFLTGGSNAYELYVKSKLPSLAHTLAAQGYSRTGLHPYYGNSWKRTRNYPFLGFEQFISLENILGEELVQKQRDNEITYNEFRDTAEALYPDDQVLLRRFVSDSFDFRYLENLLEERDSENPEFVFNVTMQNHGGYDSSYTNFEQQVRLTSSEEFYPKANRFLSLMYETDKAFEELINYYSSVSEPYLILMFGDHHPNIENGFVEEVLGKSLEDLTDEERQRRYATPFVIWANYNINEGYIDRISANYLSTLLLQTAGLETTVYNDYLSALYRYIPVIDNAGYITADGEYHSYNEKNEYTSMLKDYEKIQFNNLFSPSLNYNELFYLENKEELS